MKICLLCAVFILSLSVFAQVPQRINYQAVARDAAGAILTNRNISLRLSIHDVSATGTIVYQETHSSTTNQFGLFSLAIGGGSVVSGNFQAINWALNDKFLQVEMDAAGGTSYINMGTSQLLSVPFAQHAKTVATGDNWGSQSVQSSSLLSGNGTASTPLTVASPAQNYRSLTTNGSGTVGWSDRGGYAVTAAGTIANASTTPWDILDFSATQYGQNCSTCQILIRFYSPVARTLFVRFPNDPNPVENVYDIAAGRSIIVGVWAQNGQFQYYSNTGGQLKYQYLGFFK